MEKKNEFIKEVLIGAAGAAFAFVYFYLASAIFYFIDHEIF